MGTGTGTAMASANKYPGKEARYVPGVIKDRQEHWMSWQLFKEEK